MGPELLVANIFKIIGSILLTIGFSLGVFLINNKTPFKNLNFYLKSCLNGVFYFALGVCLHYLGVVPNTSLSSNTILSCMAIAPLIAGLIYSYPAAIVSGFFTGLFSHLVLPKTLAVPFMATCFFTAVVSSLANVFLFKKNRPKWYYAGLGAVLIECFKSLIIFVFNVNNMEEAYSILRYGDSAAVFIEFFTISVTFVSINILNKEKKDKTLRLSTKMQKHVFISSFVVLAILSISSYFIVQSRSEYNIYNEINLETIDIDNEVQITEEDDEFTHFTKYVGITKNRRVRTSGFSIVVLNTYKTYDGKEHQRGSIVSTREGTENIIGDGKTDVPFRVNGNKAIYDFEQYFLDVNSEIKTVRIQFDHDATKTPYVAIMRKCKSGCHIIISMVTLDEVNINSNVIVRLVIYIEFIGVILLYAVFFYLTNKYVVSRIYKVNSELEEIVNDDFKRHLHIDDTIEFELLTNHINTTLDKVKQYAFDANRKIEDELTVASKIQYSSVPSLFPNVKDFDIYASMNTAKQVGGDFYDYIVLDDHRLMFLIADVSGKGISAAMFMMRAKTFVRSLALTGMPLSLIAEKANDELCTQNDAAFFITAWLGVLNRDTGVLEHVNCGHCNPLLCINGEFKYLVEKPNFVLAGAPGIKFRADSITLNRGDMIYLYTDGVTEAMDVSKKLFGNKRLLEVMKKEINFTSKQICEYILDDVNTYQTGTEQADDITMIAVRYFGKEGEDLLKNKEADFVAKLENASIATAFVRSHIIKHNGSEKFQITMCVVIESLFSLYVKNAHKDDTGEISIDIQIYEDTVHITFRDTGFVFNPLSEIVIPPISENEDITERNFSILILKKYVENITYHRHNNNNMIFFEKKFERK